MILFGTEDDPNPKQKEEMIKLKTKAVKSGGSCVNDSHKKCFSIRAQARVCN